MKIIDAQIHIWSQTVTPPSGLHRKVEKFTAEEALKEMDEAGVDAALIHPPYSWDPTSNQLALAAAQKYPDRFAVMGQFELDDPESRKRIVGWRKQPGMMGLRWALLYPDQQKALHEGRLDWVWPAAEKEGIPVATMAGLFLKPFRKIAEAHPRTEADHRPLRPAASGEGREGLRQSRRALFAGEAAQRRGQGDRCAGLLDASLPVQEPA